MPDSRQSSHQPPRETQASETGAPEPFRSVSPFPDKDPVKWLTWGYIAALFIIGLMSISIHLTITKIVAEQDSIAGIVSQSAEQTTLAQRVALNASTYIYEKDDAARLALQASVKRMKDLHAELMQQGREGNVREAVAQIYFAPPYELNKKVDAFIAHSDRLLTKDRASLSGKDPDYAGIMRQVDGNLGNSLSSALVSYESAIINKIEKLQSFQRLAIFVIIATLICEAFFIYVPLVGRVRRYADELKTITMLDLLTGIGNRRYFMFRGHQEMQRCRRLKKDLCLALVDLDKFKDINEAYGAKSGDMVLRQFVRVIQHCMRMEDVFARIGGEEFAILLPHTGVKDAAHILERMRDTVEQTEFIIERDQVISLTMSAGVTGVHAGNQDFDASVIMADIALYDAKREGRNRVVVKEPESFFTAPAE